MPPTAARADVQAGVTRRVTHRYWRRSALFRGTIAPVVGIAPLFLFPTQNWEFAGRGAAEIYLPLCVAVGGLFLFLWMITRGGLSRLTVAIGVAGMVFFASFLTSLAVNHSATADSTFSSLEKVSLFKSLAVVLWLCFLVEADWSARVVPRMLVFVGIPLYLATDLMWVAEGMPSSFIGFTTHKNNLGVSAGVMTVLAFQYLRRPSGRISWLMVALMALAFIALVASGSRASQGMTVVALFLPPVLGHVRDLDGKFVFIFIPLAILLLAVPFAYVWLSTVLGSDATFLGRPIFNGRERFWGEIIKDIPEYIVYGHGYEYVHELVGYEKVMQSHNVSLGVLYHGGVVGFLAFVLWQATICTQLLKRLGRRRALLGLSYFGSCLFLNQSFEISLCYLQATTAVLLLPVAVGLSAPQTVPGAFPSEIPNVPDDTQLYVSSYTSPVSNDPKTSVSAVESS